MTWQGRCEDMDGLWLRPCGPDKALLPRPTEVAEEERLRADQESLRADQEHERAEGQMARAEAAEKRAEQERDRAERLLARLRELGVEE